MSNGKFTKVYPAVWSSQRFMGLASSDAKLLYLYFLTSEHQNSAGAYRLPDGYAATDLGWPIDQYQRLRSELIEAGLIAFDHDNATVYIERWFSHCPMSNEKHATGTRRLIGNLDSEILASKVLQDFDAAELLRKGPPSSNVVNASDALLRSRVMRS